MPKHDDDRCAACGLHPANCALCHDAYTRATDDRQAAYNDASDQLIAAALMLAKYGPFPTVNQWFVFSNAVEKYKTVEQQKS